MIPVILVMAIGLAVTGAGLLGFVIGAHMAANANRE